MTRVSQPEVNVTKIPASTSQSNEPQKVLIIGQQVAAATATSGVLQTEIGNSNEEDTLFGQNSMLAGMVRAFKAINQLTRVDAIPLDDAAGVAATGTITIVGTATVAGTINFVIGSRENHTYAIAVAVGDTETDVADALTAANIADADAPFTVSNVAGVVTVTADQDGTAGNEITIEVSAAEVIATGLTSATIVAMASGATDPTLTNIFDVIADIRYQTIVFPAAYGYTFITDELDARFNTDNDVLDGVGIATLTDTLSNIKTAAAAENSQSLVIISNLKTTGDESKGSAMVELNENISAQVAAIRSLRLTENSNISRFIVTTAGALDTRGGAALASLPYFNTPLANLPLIDEGVGFSKTEIEELKTNGACVLGNNSGRTSIIMDEFVTTYKTDAASNADPTWKFLNSVDTASAAAEYIFNNLKSDFSQSRLTDGDLISGRAMANESKIRGAMVGYYQALAGEDFVLVEAGEDALAFFKDNLTVTIDKSAGSVTMTAKLPIVTQIRVITVPLQIVFSLDS